jgi:hypothetical protein
VRQALAEGLPSHQSLVSFSSDSEVWTTLLLITWSEAMSTELLTTSPMLARILGATLGAAREERMAPNFS